MEKETKNFKLELSRLVWYMRGGVTLDEMYASGPEDREIFSKLIKENLETAKKTSMPFF
jgi:hypothetical protein|tara:strand:+ start:1566 stop:1742 length:177 start_codon:yes stop_codon:yes gene_type:complete